MSMKTFYVVQPFYYGRKGFGTGQAYEAPSVNAATRRAESSVNIRFCGAVAFSREVDIESGEFGETIVLGKYGRLPEDIEEMMSE